MKTLAVIPARGGSKGLPRKNVLPLCGKPLIAYSIEAAREAGVGRIVVSTDDNEIARIAMEHGAEVPFLRPAHLANDEASGTAVILHAIEQLRSTEAYNPEVVVLLQPTSPLRSASDIARALELHERHGCSVIGVRVAREYPQWMKRMDEQGRLHTLFPDLAIPSARQHLEPSYLVNGAIYLSSCDSLMQSRSLYGSQAIGYVMPWERSIDIDTLDDFRYAEFRMLSDR